MDRIFNRMKVTALIPDDLVNEINAQARGKNLTECLIIALKEWLSLKKLSSLNRSVEERPLEFRVPAAKLRAVNRKR